MHPCLFPPGSFCGRQPCWVAAVMGQGGMSRASWASPSPAFAEHPAGSCFSFPEGHRYQTPCLQKFRNTHQFLWLSRVDIWVACETRSPPPLSPHRHCPSWGTSPPVIHLGDPLSSSSFFTVFSPLSPVFLIPQAFQHLRFAWPESVPSLSAPLSPSVCCLIPLRTSSVPT